MTPAQTLLLLAASLAAGVVNSIAGGGTLLTFPSLLAAGFTPLSANGTNSLALVPGSAAAAWGYGNELKGRKKEVLLLGIPSLVGGVVGAWLTRAAGNDLFAKLVPWLILGATALFILQEPIKRYVFRSKAKVETASRQRLAFVAVFQLCVATYGGFFGAGMGILMLAALGQLGWDNLHEMNALKNIIAACINATASITFIVLHQIVWPVAAMMAVGAILGGYAGARLAQRLGQRAVRFIVIGIGLSIAAWMFARQLG